MVYWGSMSVTVQKGTNFALTNAAVLKAAAVKADLSPVLVLVPDRFTLQAEQIMLGYQPQLLNTRVITFSMLYQMVAEELNRGAKPTQILDKTTAVLHLWTAIKQVQADLQWFKKSVNHYDFAAKIYNTLNQMRSSCVDFATLPDQAQTAFASKKYHDLNLIYQRYRANLAERTDSSGMLEYLMAHLKESVALREAAVFVCGFTSLSPARMRVLDVLCQVAKTVTIAASEAELQKQLAKYPFRTITTPTFKPKTYTARALTERGEAEVVAQKVVTLLKQGVAPEDIVILLTEFDTLAPVWSVVCEKYQLPVNLDVGQKLSTTAEAKYLRDLLELAINDNAENTVAVMYNQASGLDAELPELENKILRSNLRARYLPEIKKLTATKDWVALCQELATFTTNEKLQDILTRLAGYPSLAGLSLRELITLFWSLCCATKVSNIPQYVNRILIAPVNDWVPTAVRHLFIANCTAENFPQGQADNDILQEADLAGTTITPTPKLQRERNYRHALLLPTVATDGVFWSGTREDFNPAVEPASTDFALTAYDTPITVGAELFIPEKRVKTTMVEKFYECPRLNFWQNGLRLRPRDLYELKPNQIGSAIHKALEVYFGGKATINQAVAAGLKELAYDSPPLVANLTKEIRFIIENLTTAFADGKFKIYALEKKITVPLANGYTLVGRVDRIDVAPTADGGKAVLVLDYKTGTLPASIAKSIYLGNKLQLPLYAGALRSVGNIAGAGYLPLVSGYAQGVKTPEIKGFIAKDYIDLFAPQVLNLKTRQYVEPMVIAKMCRHAQDLVDQAVNRLVAGEVHADPVEEEACKWCPVRLMCPHANNNYRGDGVKVAFADFDGGKNA